MSAPLLAVDDLHVTFRRSGGPGRRSNSVRAVRGVSFELQAGQTLGIAGESGSGKSTIARTLMGINKPAGGSMLLDGVDVTNRRGSSLAAYRRTMQMIFQDPYDSLDPRMTVGDTLLEAVRLRKDRVADPRGEVRALLEKVGLSRSFADRRPRELSGGQRQRVSIARALSVDPRLILCDEAVSALDVSVRAQILNLLADIQDEFGLTYLVVAHDLALVEHFSSSVGVMYLGSMAELGPTDTVFARPKHPYTQALLASVPRPDPDHRAPVGVIKGEIGSAMAPPPGCKFHPRCPYAEEVCKTTVPDNRMLGPQHLVACHFAETIVPPVQASVVSL